MDELYVIARRVLLDALEALGPHRNSVVVVGAQAVYLRVGDADLAVEPFTTDADLALDPSTLAAAPPLEDALGRAGFVPSPRGAVGVWETRHLTTLGAEAIVQVDLLVPRTVSPGRGRRSARLPGHRASAARIVAGLEGAIVDLDRMSVPALEPRDERVIDVHVAGPAALLVAKVHKIAERTGTERSNDKDALDVLRLLRGVPTTETAGRMRALRVDGRSAPAADRGLRLLADLFGDRGAEGSRMAAAATRGRVDEDEVRLSCAALAGELLAAMEAP